MAIDQGLGGCRVLDLSSSIAGSYCTLLLAQAGAAVTVLEVDAPHPLRIRRSVGARRAGVLFEHLTVGKDVRSGSSARSPDWHGLDVVVTDGGTPYATPGALADAWPHLIVVAITPYGLVGPFAGRPGNDFTAQADGGALTARALPDGVPFAMGGDEVEWLAGSYAAAASVAAWWGRRRAGRGDLLDVSLTEVAHVGATLMANVYDSFLGRPDRVGPPGTVETPSIEPARDGYVGVTTNTPAQLAGFLEAIDRADLVGDARFMGQGGRWERWTEWNALVHERTRDQPAAELLARLRERRVPAAIVQDAPGVLELEQVQARGCIEPAPDGSFLRPGRAWRVHPSRTARGAVGALPGRVEGDLPLSGLRVIDLTAWWAGPSGTALLAAFGADVVHVEPARRPDGIRLVGLALGGHERWFDRSFFFHQINVNKRGLAIDLDAPEGRQLLLDLVAHADVVVENATPRVLERQGLAFDDLVAVNPRLVMVRMPAFGLDGPWRDQPGFAQTMEQLTGLAWVTGHVDDQPRVPRGPCDPNGGLHAALAALTALLDVDRDGVGRLVEAPLLDSALAIAAEQVVEWTANGIVLGRRGNRSEHAAPQGLYPGRRPGTWLAISCEDDQQWQQLVALVADPVLEPWRQAGVSERRARHDEIDGALVRWSIGLEPADAAERLAAVGVPAAEGRDPRDVHLHPQLVARGFFEPLELPTLGEHLLPTWPFRSRWTARWARTPAPSFGEHHDEVLSELGLDDRARADLLARGIITNAPSGA